MTGTARKIKRIYKRKKKKTPIHSSADGNKNERMRSAQEEWKKVLCWTSLWSSIWEATLDSPKANSAILVTEPNSGTRTLKTQLFASLVTHKTNNCMWGQECCRVISRGHLVLPTSLEVVMRKGFTKSLTLSILLHFCEHIGSQIALGSLDRLPSQNIDMNEKGL